MADRVTAIMPLRITAATPQRPTTTATPPHTTADTGRVTMLPSTMVPGIGALFAPPTPTTAPGPFAGIPIVGDSQRRASGPDNESRQGAGGRCWASAASDIRG